jgi:hypothetical protein
LVAKAVAVGLAVAVTVAVRVGVTVAVAVAESPGVDVGVDVHVAVDEERIDAVVVGVADWPGRLSWLARYRDDPVVGTARALVSVGGTRLLAESSPGDGVRSTAARVPGCVLGGRVSWHVPTRGIYLVKAAP